ncbi:hypothetical protein Pmani_034590 [Petrolisthes manimaculis]|uniref:Uncharacterized protein n=1 Tax=Petrolisthes manimaculis TaxID=1843537 RepID=A0AAE1NP17_9EUCA|nr:hypothetical protein Pmani_034590 [Petrolisthes manimaculis]
MVTGIMVTVRRVAEPGSRERVGRSGRGRYSKEEQRVGREQGPNKQQHKKLDTGWKDKGPGLLGEMKRDGSVWNEWQQRGRECCSGGDGCCCGWEERE